jgi:hypothetical protein
MLKYGWLILIFAPATQAADVCRPADFTGPYVFQLFGMTDISGTPQPTVSLGRIVFDGSGKMTGTSSAVFSGLLLGNPVTGTYELQQDCTLTWQLQDDSGAYQHFSGKISPDLVKVQFRQTDRGGTRGTMEKTSDSCSSVDLPKKFIYTVSGSTKAMQAGQVGHSVSAKGVIDSAGFQVDQGCSVRFIVTTPDGETISMRGFLVNGSKEILAFQTDPGAMVSARLTAVPE